MIENEVGDEETLIVSRWRDETGKNRTDYYLSHGHEDSELEEYARVIKDVYCVEECFIGLFARRMHLFSFDAMAQSNKISHRIWQKQRKMTTYPAN